VSSRAKRTSAEPRDLLLAMHPQHQLASPTAVSSRAKRTSAEPRDLLFAMHPQHQLASPIQCHPERSALQRSRGTCFSRCIRSTNSPHPYSVIPSEAHFSGAEGPASRDASAAPTHPTHTVSSRAKRFSAEPRDLLFAMRQSAPAKPYSITFTRTGPINPPDINPDGFSVGPGWNARSSRKVMAL